MPGFAANLGRIALTVVFTGIFAAACHAQSGWKPTKHVEVIVGADAAGTQDRIARTMIQLVEKMQLAPVTFSVVNKPGAAQLTAIAYMNTHRADPHYLTLVSSAWQNTAIINDDKAALNDISPVINLLISPSLYIVAPDSRLQTAQDLVDSLKKGLGSVSFTMSAPTGSQNWLTIVAFANKAGVDPRKLRIVINTTGTESTNQVIGKHADIGVGGLDTNMGLLEAGKVRNLGLITPARLNADKVKDMKTMREQGVDAVSNNWYAIVGPKGMAADQAAYWDDVFRKAANSEEGKRIAAERFWNLELVGPKDFNARLQADEEAQRKVMVDLGLIKK